MIVKMVMFLLSVFGHHIKSYLYVQAISINIDSASSWIRSREWWWIVRGSSGIFSIVSYHLHFHLPEQALMSSTNFCHGQINKHASEGTEKTTTWESLFLESKPRKMCTLSILSYDLYLTSSKDDFIKSKLVFRFLILDLDFRDRISLVFKICQTFSITDFFYVWWKWMWITKP